MTQIAIERLCKSYSRAQASVAAVAELDLTIAAGEFVTLLGPSGCGKTTTLRLIAGYLTPDSGRILVDGRVLSSPSAVVPPEHRDMGMVFQNYAVWPHKTVFENVGFGLFVRKTSPNVVREKVAAALALVNLSGFEQRYPSELSGGQQQRVALARSLVVEPKILLLDEPLSNLDAKLRDRMRVELKELQRRTGITFIYVTHDQAEALSLSDRIAVMHEGTLRQYGTPQDVYRKPADRVVADFMGSANFVRATVRDVRSGKGIVEAGSLRLEVALPLNARAGSTVEVAIRPENVRFAGDGASAVSARVVECSYFGSRSDYVVSVGDVQLRVQATAETDVPVGSEIMISVDTDACNVYLETA